MLKFNLLITSFVIFTLQSFSVNPQSPNSFKEIMKEKGIDFSEIYPQQINENKKIMAEGYLVESVNALHFEGNDEYTYTYNKANQILTQTKNYWDDDQPISQRITNTYDVNGNKLTVLTQEIGLDDEDWQNISRTSNTFNEKDSLLVYLEQKWNGEDWQNVSRELNKYNAEANSNTFTKEEWNLGKKVWESDGYKLLTYDSYGNLISIFLNSTCSMCSDSREFLAYDGNGNLLVYTYEYWADGISSWVNVMKVEFTYDSNNNMLTRLDAEGNWESEEWENKSRNTREYDAEKISMVLDEIWDSEKEIWVGRNKSTFTFNSKGYQIESLNQEWIDGEWVNEFRNSYTYNSSGSLSTELYEAWENEEWLSSSKKSNSYDTKNNLLVSVFQKWLNEQWKNAEANFGFEDFYGNNFGNYRSYKIEINWMIISSAKENSENIFNVNIFPNPAQNVATIKYNLEQNGNVKIKITNINGEVINIFNQNYQTSGEHEIQINTNILYSGQYFMTLEQNGMSSTKAFQIFR
jgi:Secretion system C-terminal sorting domain